MRVFFDTNVLLDGYYNRSGATASDQALLTCQLGSHSGWIAWHTLSNAYYLVRGHSKSNATAIQFITDLLAWAEVAITDRGDALSAANSGNRDFEDALQIAAAHACRADVIITRNVGDFKTATMPVMTPEAFLVSLCASP